MQQRCRSLRTAVRRDSSGVISSSYILAEFRMEDMCRQVFPDGVVLTRYATCIEDYRSTYSWSDWSDQMQNIRACIFTVGGLIQSSQECLTLED